MKYTIWPPFAHPQDLINFKVYLPKKLGQNFFEPGENFNDYFIIASARRLHEAYITAYGSCPYELNELDAPIREASDQDLLDPHRLFNLNPHDFIHDCLEIRSWFYHHQNGNTIPTFFRSRKNYTDLDHALFHGTLNPLQPPFD